MLTPPVTGPLELLFVQGKPVAPSHVWALPDALDLTLFMFPRQIVIQPQKLMSSFY